jgi:aspartyl/asparaginyl-tRNA synthetase
MAEQELAERPKEDVKEDVPLDAEGKPLSKGAIKKLQKEKEKAEKAAKRKAEEDAQKAQQEANDVSKEDYGDLPPVGSPEWKPTTDDRVTLAAISKEYKEKPDEAEGKEIVFEAIMENAREQSAKLSFLVLGDGENNIQAVVAASDTLSRQMVKFAKNISQQSYVLCHATLKKPKEYVKSTTIGSLEVHVKKIYVTARADTLPIQVEDCEGAIPKEENVDGKDTTQATDGETGRPVVALSTRLNNRPIDLRAKLNHAIFRIKSGVFRLFCEYLWSKDFECFQTPKLLGAPSEGGASVFKVSYFNTHAYLAQSPQLHKQMLITAQFKRVFEIGPVFRAENSNTYRHLTEFTGLDLEMEFEKDYQEVVDVVEGLMLFIFNGLRERYAKETELVRKVYGIKDFALPEAGKTPRLKFWEGIAMLREAGVEIGDFDDLRFVIPC